MSARYSIVAGRGHNSTCLPGVVSNFDRVKNLKPGRRDVGKIAPPPPCERGNMVETAARSHYLAGSAPYFFYSSILQKLMYICVGHTKTAPPVTLTAAR
jgi:hypothetical protein